jgi:hypothetical protein
LRVGGAGQQAFGKHIDSMALSEWRRLRLPVGNARTLLAALIDQQQHPGRSAPPRQPAG